MKSISYSEHQICFPGFPVGALTPFQHHFQHYQPLMNDKPGISFRSQERPRRKANQSVSPSSNMNIIRAKFYLKRQRLLFFIRTDSWVIYRRFSKYINHVE